jgi:uncharacterized protein
MPTATFTFHGSLNDFLPAARRGRELTREFEGSPAIADSIQALGAPHTEVDLILAGDRRVGFEYRLRPGDRIAVYGLDRPERGADDPGLIPPPPVPIRFVLDGHLGRLARYLRMLGFDTLYDSGATDAELARCSAGEARILITRDRGLLKRSIVRWGCLPRDDDPRRQLGQVVDRYRLAALAAPFTRCVRCNGILEAVDRSEVVDRLADEPRTLKYFDTFARCDACGAIYWPGSHFERMNRLTHEVLHSAARMGENRADEEPGRREA